MTPERMKQAFDTCRKAVDAVLQGSYFSHKAPAKLSDADAVKYGSKINNREVLRHLLYMCNTGKKLVDEGQRDKAHRWLGFVQGVLWMSGIATIQEMKEWNRPDPEEPTDNEKSDMQIAPAKNCMSCKHWCRSNHPSLIEADFGTCDMLVIDVEPVGGSARWIKNVITRGEHMCMSWEKKS